LHLYFRNNEDYEVFHIVEDVAVESGLNHIVGDDSCPPQLYRQMEDFITILQCPHLRSCKVSPKWRPCRLQW
jgi:hypothetical protein